MSLFLHVKWPFQSNWGLGVCKSQCNIQTNYHSLLKFFDYSTFQKQFFSLSTSGGIQTLDLRIESQMFYLCAIRAQKWILLRNSKSSRHSFFLIWWLSDWRKIMKMKRKYKIVHKCIVDCKRKIFNNNQKKCLKCWIRDNCWHFM